MKTTLITEQEYLAALSVVQKYHRQIKLMAQYARHIMFDMREDKKYESFEKIKKGDYLEYIGGSTSQYLQIGKRYRVKDKSDPNRQIVWIVNDAKYTMTLNFSCFKY